MNKLLLTLAALTLTTTAALAERYHTSGDWRHALTRTEEGKAFCLAMDDLEIGDAHILLFYVDQTSFSIQLSASGWTNKRGKTTAHNVSLQFTDMRTGSLKFDKIALFINENTVANDSYDEELVTALGTHQSVTISLNGENPHLVSLKGAYHAIKEWYACIEKIS